MYGNVHVRPLKDITALRRFDVIPGEYDVTGAAAGLKVRWLEPDDVVADFGQGHVSLELSLATGAGLKLCLQEGLFHALLQGIEPAQFWQLDAYLRCACLQVRNNGALDWLKQRWQCGAQVVGVELLTQPPDAEQALAFRLRTAAGLDYQPGLVAPVDAGQRCSLSVLYEVGEPAEKIAVAGVPLRLEVIVGRVQVAMADLRELQTNDLIILKAGEFSLATALLCMQGSPLFSAEVERNLARVTKILRSEAMADTENLSDLEQAANAGDNTGVAVEEAGDAQRLNLEDVEVALNFSLGSITRTVAEIADIAEGDLLELPRPSGDCVDVLVNGKRLAKGEPVRIEKQVGIRIVKIYSG